MRRFGKAAVEMESGFADLKVKRGRTTTLIEVKSDSRPRFAIRQALGQLLEYAYLEEQAGQRVSELVVAGPGELTALDRAYMKHLRDARKLPVRYVCVRRGIDQIDL